jgi:hypothetical protein
MPQNAPLSSVRVLNLLNQEIVNDKFGKQLIKIYLCSSFQFQ